MSKITPNFENVLHFVFLMLSHFEVEFSLVFEDVHKLDTGQDSCNKVISVTESHTAQTFVTVPAQFGGSFEKT